MSATKKINEDLKDEIFTLLKNKHYLRRCGNKNHKTYIAVATVEECVKYVTSKIKENREKIENTVKDIVLNNQFCEECNRLESIHS